MRVLRPGRIDPTASHPGPRARSPQPRPDHQGDRPDDVRRQDEPVRRRRGGSSAASRRPRVPNGHPPERPLVRGTEPRPPDLALSHRTPRGRWHTPRWPTSCGARDRRVDALRAESPGIDGGIVTVRPERSQSLGRGLASLIPQRSPGQPVTIEIATSRIQPNPHQPRKRFDPEGLASLTASIAEHGVLQPILVTESGRWLPAGRRRAPSSRRPGSRPRADPGGRAAACRSRSARAGARREPPARGSRSPRDRRRVSAADRRLRVEPGRGRDASRSSPLDGGQHPPIARSGAGVQAAVADGRLSEGHGRALGGLAPELQDRVLDSVIGQELSVRQTEELVRRLREPRPEAAGRAARRADPDLERVEEDLRRALGTKVSLARSRRGGRIVIEYYSDEELGRLYERLTGGTA